MNNIDYSSIRFLAATANHILFTPVKNYSMIISQNNLNLADKEVKSSKILTKRNEIYRLGRWVRSSQLTCPPIADEQHERNEL